jgi:hypothetical protein
LEVRWLQFVRAIRTTTATGSGWASKKIIGTCPPLVLCNPRIRGGFSGKAKGGLMSANPCYLDVNTLAINSGTDRVRDHVAHMARFSLKYTAYV